jgi:hypothetical protein
VAYETKGKSARCLVTVGAASTAKASSEGWRLRLRPNREDAKVWVEDESPQVRVWGVDWEIFRLYRA